MIPPEATTGTRTASTICGTSASVPTMPTRTSPVDGSKRAAMAARLAALRDDDVDAGALERDRFIDGRGRAGQHEPARLDLAATAAAGSMPNVKLKTDAPPSSAASSCASKSRATGAGGSGRGRPSSSKNGATRATAADGVDVPAAARQARTG